MKVSITLGFTGGLLLGMLLSKQPVSQPISATIMNSQFTNSCRIDPIQADLRIWLDPIPRSSSGSGALPPGMEPPAPQPQGSETHALNLELTLLNASQNQQAVQVVGWSWNQGDQTNQAVWNIQPDMSPLNRYSQTQRQLIQLHENQTVTATINLEINGQSCQLQAQTQP